MLRRKLDTATTKTLIIEGPQGPLKPSVKPKLQKPNSKSPSVICYMNIIKAAAVSSTATCYM